MNQIKTMQEYEEILAYLKKNIEQCIYITVDLEKYGYQNESVKFWYSKKENDYDTILMKYYDSFQIFSADDEWEPTETIELLNRYNVITICGKKSMIEVLEPLLKQYSVAYGIIVKDDKFRTFKQFEKVEKANSEDIDEIVELMYTDEDYKNNYTKEGLKEQLFDRMCEKKGRNYIIRENGKIVAHTAVYAECEEIAVEGGLIVDEEYKKKMYGMIIHEYIKSVLHEEGKAIYGFRIVENMQKYAKLGKLTVVGEYGKMSRKEI